MLDWFIRLFVMYSFSWEDLMFPSDIWKTPSWSVKVAHNIPWWWLKASLIMGSRDQREFPPFFFSDPRDIPLYSPNDRKMPAVTAVSGLWKRLGVLSSKYNLPMRRKRVKYVTLGFMDYLQIWFHFVVKRHVAEEHITRFLPNLENQSVWLRVVFPDKNIQFISSVTFRLIK